MAISSRGVRLATSRQGDVGEIRADFVVDATGPGGLLRRALRIPSQLGRTATALASPVSAISRARASSPTWLERRGRACPRDPIRRTGRPCITCSTRAGCTCFGSTTTWSAPASWPLPPGARRLELHRRGRRGCGLAALLARYPSLAGAVRRRRSAVSGALCRPRAAPAGPGGGEAVGHAPAHLRLRRSPVLDRHRLEPARRGATGRGPRARGRRGRRSGTGARP